MYPFLFPFITVVHCVMLNLKLSKTVVAYLHLFCYISSAYFRLSTECVNSY